MMSLAVALVAIAITPAGAAKEKATPVTLTQAGQQLESSYAAQLEALKAELTKSLPLVNQQKKDAFLKAREDEITATKGIEEAQAKMGGINTAKALVAHAKGKWIGGADKGIAAAKASLAKAKTAAEREAAEKDLANW